MQADFVGSQEYFEKQGGGTNDGFLTALYGNVLGRPVDPQGAAFWGAALQSGESQQAVAAGVLNSLESNTLTVEGLYSQYLRRAADPQGLQTWVGVLSQGGSVEQVIQGIVGSLEYYTTF